MKNNTSLHGVNEVEATGVFHFVRLWGLQYNRKSMSFGVRPHLALLRLEEQRAILQKVLQGLLLMTRKQQLLHTEQLRFAHYGDSL